MKDEEYKCDYKDEDEYVHEYTYNNINMPILFAFINKLYAIICWLWGKTRGSYIDVCNNIQWMTFGMNCAVAAESWMWRNINRFIYHRGTAVCSAVGSVCCVQCCMQCRMHLDSVFWWQFSLGMWRCRDGFMIFIFIDWL